VSTYGLKTAKVTFVKKLKALMKMMINPDNYYSSGEIIDHLNIFVPGSSGRQKEVADSTLKAAQEIFPCIEGLLTTTNVHSARLEPIQSFCVDAAARQASEELG
jgi:hypothetical protein